MFVCAFHQSKCINECELRLINGQPSAVSTYVILSLSIVAPCISLLLALGVWFFPLRPGSDRLARLLEIQTSKVDQQKEEEENAVKPIEPESSNITDMVDMAAATCSDDVGSHTVKQRAQPIDN